MATKSLTLDQNASAQIVQGLSQLLADTYITYLKTQNFHWNITDSRFHSLHKFFEELYKELAEAIDEIAERICMLRMKSPGTMRRFLDIASLEEAEDELTGDQMIHDLAHDRDALAKHINPRIDEAQKLGDEGTADLLIQHLKIHQKAAWMLRSHLLDESV